MFPYSYLDSAERLKERTLPPKEAFFNDISQSHITDSEYSYARYVWDILECETLQDYMEAYLITDVLLLTDIFENFRSDSIRAYKLDPAHYLSNAHYTFDAFLRSTKCVLQNFRDPDHYLYSVAAIRGGLSMISHRHARANNPLLKNFDPQKPQSYIVYLDANNLYGWAMSQPLPTGGFSWMSEDELTLEKLMEIPVDSDWGCLVEVDLSYPQHLHDRHSDLPLVPHHHKVSAKQLSPYARRLVKKHKIRASVNNLKLFTSFLPKERYILHYRILQFQKPVLHGIISTTL